MDLPVAPKGGLAGFVERTLKQALMTGQLKPGQRLVTRELAGSLQTSLTPVREALLKLVAAGALEAIPGQAFQVPLMDVRRYREIAAIRHSVEGLAAEHACAAMTKSCLAELVEINDGYRRARRKADIAQALSLNQSFRFTLYRAAEMPVLLAIIEGLWLQIGPSLNFLFPRPAHVDFDRHAYDDVIGALRTSDRARTRRAIEAAVGTGTQILLANLDGTAGQTSDRLSGGLHLP